MKGVLQWEREYISPKTTKGTRVSIVTLCWTSLTASKECVGYNAG